MKSKLEDLAKPETINCNPWANPTWLSAAISKNRYDVNSAEDGPIRLKFGRPTQNDLPETIKGTKWGGGSRFLKPPGSSSDLELSRRWRRMTSEMRRYRRFDESR